MRKPHESPLHGIPIYNPQLLGREELLRTFVARQEELAQIVAALHRETTGQPQHHLIVGARGMGKTTLLARIRHAIADDELLARHCLPLVFPEEQYNVGTLADFWLNCVDALADMLEAMHKLELVEGLDREVVRIQAMPAERERRRLALELLCDLATRLDRRLVLLVDNMDTVLDRLQDEEWALREVLSAESKIQLIGATSAPLESYYRHDRAFYDFFRVHHLTGLGEAETFTVLGKLAAATGNDRVAQLLDDEPARIKTVRLMSGGNPRTIVLMFTLLDLGVEGDVRTDIERLLDHCTPLYKHRIEALPPQTQQVVDALAMHWHPATAADVATATHLKVNAASSQLERLVKDGLVEKVDIPGSSRLGFQISERFFNIWCLMRASRRVRRRLAWFVEFLRMMFGLDELKRMARRHLDGVNGDEYVRRAELGLALADVIDEPSMRYALETDSVRALCVEQTTRARLSEILDLHGQDAGLKSRAERMRILADAHEAILSAGEHRPGWDAEGFWARLSGSLWLSLEDKYELACKVDKMNDSQLSGIAAALGNESARWEGMFIQEELAHLIDAIRVGDLDHLTVTSEELSAAALIHGDAVVPCALAAASEDIEVNLELFSSVITCSRSLFSRARWAKCAAKGGVPSEEIHKLLAEIVEEREWGAEAFDELGDVFLFCLSDSETAVTMYRRAVDKDPRLPGPYHGLAIACCRLGRFEEAEIAYRASLERDPKQAACWEGLGTMLSDDMLRYEAAEKAFREAIVQDETRSSAWAKLGYLLHLDIGRYSEAEIAYRETLKRDSTRVDILRALGHLLHRRLGRFEEAEVLYQEALAREPQYARWWMLLGELRAEQMRLPIEAGVAYREAVVVDPGYAEGWNSLAWFLYRHKGPLDEALKAAETAVALEVDSPHNIHTLSTIFVARGDWKAAEPYARQFISASQEVLDEIWADVLQFFVEVVAQGFYKEAQALLVSMGLEERWEPLVRGLEVVARGAQLLGTFAPEMREAVRLVLERIAPDVLAA